jgi:hypothetical protein
MPDMNDKAVQRPWLKAYTLGTADDWAIEAASPKRDWMDDTFKKIAYRCLPLIAANQMGWVIRCPANLTATWSGKPDNHGVRIVYEADSAHLTGVAISHFGGGVLTFVLPWLFRTSPGFGLVLRGPTNESKDHVFPLDAVIETDWSPYTFTMNWRLSQPEVPVRFRKGDTICMLQPYPLALLEQFDCSIEPFADAPPEIQRGFGDFVQGRARNIERAPQGQYTTQRDYFAGRYPDGSPARYPRGTVASSVALGCPAEAHARRSDGEELPAPQHRTGFVLQPFRR